MKPSLPQLQLNATLERAGEGDVGAWREIVGLYSGRVYGLIVRQCGDRDLAAEVTQGTFVRVVEHLGRYREEGKFEAWLFRIAMNQLRDEMRRRKRQRKVFERSDGGSDERGGGLEGESENRRVASEASDPFEKASKEEQLTRLKQAIGELGKDDQEILHLRHTAGLGFAEIAEVLGLPLGTVLARGHRAIGKLRKMLGREWGE